MSSIGPQLPAHLSKRKRTPEDDGGADGDASTKLPRRADRPPPPPPPANSNEIGLDDESDDDNDIGPSAPPAQASRPAAGPSLPPSVAANKDAIDLSDSDSDSDSDTGPAPPPSASASSSRPQPRPESQPRPTPAAAPSAAAAGPASDSDSDSDDDYGPALPSATTKRANPIGPAMPPVEAAPQRDSWMLAPPPASTGYTERDPTRMRSRKFASKPGPAPAGPATDGGGVSSIWTETPEEKLRRLQDAVLGRSGDGGGGAAQGGGAGGARQKSKEDEERDRRIAANIEAQRGGSLYDEHSTKRRNEGVPKDEEEDDPSKRAFDRDKDMALGGKIGTAQRRELLSKAANFGGRFQKGSFL
ncbi:ABC bile acid transporter [Purpureocillium lavendulum]|uniref:ABC bile acid transporter n=1 Tax=Purpureocillium lavendulum TaxID=1247861 RepID=A0AB34FVX2_9HYPO|nr:ABC bile acid transporter [Purpureocillium lavendulum]